MFLVAIGTGALAGLAFAQVRLHLGLPGHKALFWLTPVLAARLIFGCTGSATAGVLSAATVAALTGGHFAGGAFQLPLVVLAGIILDGAAYLFGSLRWYLAIPVFGLAGMAANVVCMVHKFALPSVRGHALGVLTGPWVELVSYAGFGLLAGLAACAVSQAVIRASAARGAKRR